MQELTAASDSISSEFDVDDDNDGDEDGHPPKPLARTEKPWKASKASQSVPFQRSHMDESHGIAWVRFRGGLAARCLLAGTVQYLQVRLCSKMAKSLMVMRASGKLA